MGDGKIEEGVPRTPPPIPYSIFTSRQKFLIVTIVSFAATFTSCASNIYFPAIPIIASDLGVTAELINLTVTSYMILQGLSPTVWGAVADLHGRRATYIFTFLVFLGACIGLAETKHYYQLVILRCLQSAGSASTIAIGAGVVGDITTREERGGYMGLFQAGLLVPLAVGPILGGLFSQTLGWRAIFWFLTIYAGAFLLVLVLVLPETLRSLVGNGLLPAKGLAKSPLQTYQRRKHFNSTAISSEPTAGSVGKKASVDLLGPIRIVFACDTFTIIAFLSIYYSVWQMTVTVMSTLFQQNYQLSELQIGLTFIGNGVGCMLGTLLSGKFLDMDYRRVKDTFAGSLEDFPLERARLRTIWIYSGLQCASALVFGWTVGEKVHVSVPIIATFILGWSATAIYSLISTYLVDLYPKKGASATTALNLARCLTGAGGTAAVLPIVNVIGSGWTFTLLAGIMFAGLGLIVLQMRYGGRWRHKRERRGKEGEQ